MELKEYLKMEIEGLDRQLPRVVDGLTQEEISWQPKSGCNSIGLILFHIFKAEDSFIQARLKDTKELYESENWYQKLGLDVKEQGAHYTEAQVNAFKVPKLATILEYGAAVRKATLAQLDAAKPADFDKVMKMPWGDMPAIMLYSITVSHAVGHIGEMSYLRGLKRGMDK